MDTAVIMIELRQYQIDGLNALWSYYTNGGKGNVLLCWPTGVGKSVCPAIFIREAMRLWPNQRFMLLTHSSELVAQDADALKSVWPTAPIGIYSAGLKSKSIVDPIIYGTIQSVARLGAAPFGHRDILWVDEAHLISDEEASMYLKFIAEMKAINPALKVIGLTATQFRMGMGLLTEGKLWNEVVHDLTSMENFNKLISDGYLAPLVTKKTSVSLDVSNVAMQKGEFVASQLQHEVDKAEITWKALQEAIHHGQNRRSWLIFASGIDHANHIAEMLTQLGIDCASVHSKQSSDYNKIAIAAFKKYELRAIVNYGKLTTGFNHPGIDMIVMLRPTMSVSLWIQMLGRGTRPEPEKRDCLVLDFAKNAMRLGPVNDPVLPKKKGDKTGTVPIKLCEACGVYHHIKAVRCEVCGKPFEFEVKITERAGTDELIREPEAIQVETFDVNYMLYNKKESRTGKNPYLKVTYFCGINGIDEFVFPEASFRKSFVDWWRQRHTSEPPHFVDDVLKVTSELRQPRRIRVHVNKRYKGRLSPEVLGVEF